MRKFKLSNKNNPKFWFCFRNNRLLVTLNKNKATIPYAPDLGDLNLSPVRTQFVGKIGNIPCHSAELLDHQAPPVGMCFMDLRLLYKLLEEEFFAQAGRAIQIMNWDKNHQYCGHCNHQTYTKPNEYAKVCPHCGLKHYPTICPAIIIAITREDEILLAQGTNFTLPFYSVLSGFVEPGETLEACAHREVMEEVGIKIKNIQYFGSQPWPFPNSLMIGFTAEYDSGKICIDPIEIKDAQWFNVNNLPELPNDISISRSLINWFIKKHQ